jgi:hypothetical protein
VLIVVAPCVTGDSGYGTSTSFSLFEYYAQAKHDLLIQSPKSKQIDMDILVYVIEVIFLMKYSTSQ